MLAFLILAEMQTYELRVCVPIAMPGIEHTLNPNAPPAMQRQEIVHACETIEMPDPGHFHDEGPITDFAHDRRAFT